MKTALYTVCLGVLISLSMVLIPTQILAQGNVPFDPTGGQFGNTGTGSGASNSGVNAGQVFGPNGPNPTFDPTGGQFGNTGAGSGASNNSINAGQVFGPTSGNQSALSGNAGTETGLVKCGVSRDCTICDIFILIRDIFTFALGLLASLAVLSMVIGGVYILVSAGNSGMVSQGYSIITNAVVGLLLVMASFLLFSFLLVGLGFQEANFSSVLTFRPGEIFEVKCDSASTFNSAGPNGGGQATTGGGTSGGVTGGTVSPQEIRSLALGAGFTPDQARIMEAIAMAESSGNSSAHNKVPPDNSYGLWQINMIGALGPERRAQLGLSRNEQLFDPATNARAAKVIFDSQGLGAWSVYRSGAYRQFLRNP